MFGRLAIPGKPIPAGAQPRGSGLPVPGFLPRLVLGWSLLEILLPLLVEPLGGLPRFLLLAILVPLLVEPLGGLPLLVPGAWVERGLFPVQLLP